MELTPMEVALNLLALTGQALRFTAYTVAGVACIGLVCFGPAVFNFFVLHPCRSYLRLLPGPKRRGAFVCDLSIMCDAETSHEFNERLKKKYGRNIRAQGYGYMDDRLISYDPVTINYILNQEADRYTKPWPMRRIISKLTGGDTNQNAVSVAEGPYHHRLRKIILPAFAPSTVKSHAAVFTRKASEVCEHWRSALSEPVEAAPGIEFDEKGAPLIDVHNWFARAAFDVVGLAAFGYSFNSLRDDTNELFAAYMRLHHATRNMSPRDNLCLLIPWLERILPTENSKMAAASGLKVQNMSKMLLEQRRILTPEGDSKSILGLLLRANSKATPEERLTDEQLLAQIDSFMFGGADTTSLVIVWALYELARHPEVQKALRAELKPLGLNEHSTEQHEFGSDSGVDFDLGPADPIAVFSAIDALPMLDRVVREVVRLHPPVHSTLRVAEHDDILPVSPDAIPTMLDGSVSRAIVTGIGADGVQRTGIKIRKGELIHPQMEVLNTCRDVWGEDGFEFNPDRWLDLPPAAKNNIGIFSGLMTFSVGPHSCPASRFAIAEVKTMLAYVASSFEFEEFKKIQPHNMMVTRPYVDDEWENGFRLPLRVRAL